MIFGLQAGAHHASAKFVFTDLVNMSGFHIGWWYILPIGLLMAQYTFTGYDASAHMTEETHNASRSGPRGIVMSILVSLIAGWVLLIGDHVRDPEGELRSTRGGGGGGPGARSGSTAIGRTGAELLLLVVDRRPAVLRDVLGHRELADDLRVLPGRGAARLEPSGTR